MTQPAIILITPQLGENIGMVARAMLNCGLGDLRIVRPRDGWPSEAANRAASGALEKGVTVTLYDSTQAAIADCHAVYATTARPRDMVKQVETANTAAHLIRQAEKQGEQAGILFGAERSGLENEDIAMASHIITIPLNPDFTSLNLAQAVLLVAYEWCMAGQEQNSAFITGKTDIAPHAEVTLLVDRLIDQLEDKGFFRTEELKPTLQRNIINLFTRTRMTSQECQTFHGVISALARQETGEKRRTAL